MGRILKADFLSWQKLLATIFFQRNQSSDNRSHGFGAKFLLKKLSASDFSYEWKSPLRLGLLQLCQSSVNGLYNYMETRL